MVKIIEEITHSLVTREGFVDTFWRTLRQWREEVPCTTQRQVYDYLEGLFEEEFGKPQFESFDAFRVWRDRHRR